MAADDEGLREQRTALANTLAQRLTAHDVPLPELRELQERLKLLDWALAEQHARNKRRALVVLWPPGLVGFALLLAASVPVPSMPLSLSLKASAVQLDLSEATQLGSLTADAGMRIEGFSTLESADADLAGVAARENADSLNVDAAESRLRLLRLPAGASLGIEARRNATVFLIESPRGPVIADIELRGAATLLLGDSTKALARDYVHGEWLRLVAGDLAKPERTPPPVSVAITRRADAPLRLANLYPTRLRFVERREGGVGESGLASSLQGATLTLPSTGQILTLAAGDWLELDGLRLERFELIAGAPLLLEFNGSARVLRQRVGEFERSLKPSWLEHVSRHHLTQLLWGAAAVLWGALAWVRRQFVMAAP